MVYLKCLSGGTVSDVDLAVAGAAADEQTCLIGRVLDEAHIADRAIVHGQLDLLTIHPLSTCQLIKGVNDKKNR